MQKRKLLLGMDVGTTSLKASLVDESMNIICQSELSALGKNSCEISMSVLWEKFCCVIKQLHQKSEDLWVYLEGIGVSGQGDGLWLLDKDLQALGNAIIWNDMRAKVLHHRIARDIEAVRLLEKANQLLPGNSPMLLRWIKEFEPERYAKIGHIVSCKDWLNYCLTGEIATDITSAATAGLNLATQKVSVPLWHALDISECIDQFPPIVQAETVIGYVTTQASIHTGLKAGLPVICGLLDGSAVLFGAQVPFGQGCTIGGTTLANTVVTDERDIPDHFDALILPHAVTGNNVYSYSCLNGAGTSDYIDELLLPGWDRREEEDYIANVPAGCEGLLFQPYLIGERAPFVCPDATAGFFGMRPHHTRAHMVKAMYEGMAFSSKDAYDCIGKPLAKLYLTGGLSNSRFYAQLFSDVIGLPVGRIKTKYLGTLGVARIIALGLSVKGNSAEFSPPESEMFYPNPSKHALYQDWFAFFVTLREKMLPIWSLRGSIIERMHLSELV